MISKSAGRPSWSMRLISWLFRSEIERLAQVQAELTGKAYFQGVRDGQDGVVQMLRMLGREKEADLLQTMASDLLAGLEKRDYWPRGRVYYDS